MLLPMAHSFDQTHMIRSHALMQGRHSLSQRNKKIKGSVVVTVVLKPVEYRKEQEEEDLPSQSDLPPQHWQEETTRRNVQRNPRKRMPCPKPENTKGKVIQRTNAFTKDNRVIKQIRTLLDIGASSRVRTTTLDKSTLLSKRQPAATDWILTTQAQALCRWLTLRSLHGVPSVENGYSRLTSLSMLVFTQKIFKETTKHLSVYKNYKGMPVFLFAEDKIWCRLPEK